MRMTILKAWGYEYLPRGAYLDLSQYLAEDPINKMSWKFEINEKSQMCAVFVGHENCTRNLLYDTICIIDDERDGSSPEKGILLLPKVE